MLRRAFPLLPALAMLMGCPSNPEPEPEPEPPAITSVTISPASASTVDALTCAAEATFAGDGAVSVDFAWTIAGEAGPTGEVLPAGVAGRGAEVVCAATPRVGALVGAQGTATLTIGNARPSVTTPAIASSGGGTAPVEQLSPSCAAAAAR
jgi:hypothetical protein